VPSRAANTNHVLNMSSAFVAAGADLTLIARGDRTPPETIFEEFGLPHRFRFDLYPQRRPATLSRLLFLAHIRRSLGRVRDGAPFVFGRSCYGLLFGVPGAMPMAYDVHSYPAGRTLERMEALLFKRPNLLFVTSTTRALADHYEGIYPHMRGRFMVAPNGAPQPDIAGVRTRAAGEPLNVSYMGHLYAGRGIDLILELARRKPGVNFNIVGGEDADVRHWAAQAPANVTLHGYVRPGQLKAHYEKADVCLAPYQDTVAVAGGSGDNARWMSPLKIFEYMSYGKAIIASDSPIIREVLTPGRNALLCPANDVAAWLAAIDKLEAEPGAVERIARVALADSRAIYNWPARARSILERGAEEAAAFARRR
jgi:glycosyltransferase involved in cell wall biosynthesis